MDSPLIRTARPDDIPALLGMIRELADFENLSDQVVATEADYQESLFGEKPAAEALIVEADGEIIGYAIFFRTFSTFIGKAGLWLEDLYVKPQFRNKGIGKKLLQSGAEIARKEKAGRYEWCVLDWNKNAIELYEKAGGKILDEWRIVRMEGKEIEQLSEGQSSGDF